MAIARQTIADGNSSSNTDLTVSKQPVIATATLKEICVCATFDQVITASTFHIIVTTARLDPVVAIRVLDYVGTTIAKDVVIAWRSIKSIIPPRFGSASDHVPDVIPFKVLERSRPVKCGRAVAHDVAGCNRVA